MGFSKRIQAICNMVPSCDCVADIGCDHGQIMLCLMQSGKATKGLACDISEQSLAKAQRLFDNFDYDVDCIACDGLAHAQRADCTVIAGMGGITVSRILGHAIEGKQYILQPSDSVAELRRYLAANGFEVLQERIVHDSRYYCIISTKRGKGDGQLTPLEAELGRCNILRPDADVLGYARWRLSVHKNTLRNTAHTERGKGMQSAQHAICEQLSEFLERND